MRAVGAMLGGKYRLVRELGEGSAASAWEAENVLLERRVAVKILKPDLSEKVEVKQRFLDEARAAARLAHPHVVDVFDLGTDLDGTPFMVMELCDGETLSSILEERGAVGVDYACDLMIQILSALHAAHEAGIVHRDLKPDNVILVHPRPDQPVAKVLDFGIAQGVAGESDQQSDGLLFGTPAYMAPEQAKSVDVDARADLYSAGAMFYELLTGEIPIEGDDLADFLERLAHEMPAALSQHRDDVPESIEFLVARALAKSPDDRPASAQEFIKALVPFSTTRRAPSVIPVDRGSEPPLPLVTKGSGDKKATLQLVIESDVPPAPETSSDESAD